MTIIMKFGRREADIITAGCTAVDLVGRFVYLHNRINNEYRVRTAQPNDETKFPAIGVIVSKITDTLCRVQLKGETISLFTGLDIGKMYFLDIDGRITRTPFAPISGYSFVQSVCIATDTDKIKIEINGIPIKRRS